VLLAQFYTTELYDKTPIFVVLAESLHSGIYMIKQPYLMFISWIFILEVMVRIMEVMVTYKTGDDNNKDSANKFYNIIYHIGLLILKIQRIQRIYHSIQLSYNWRL